MKSMLALHGGVPVVSEPWPQWPAWDEHTEEAVLRVLRSGRWAISGMSTGAPSEERRFGEAFADFVGVPYGVPVVNGSAALVVALESLGVGFGDEVLVPGLVWVACASAVARIGARPVLVDIEPDTFCMCPSSAAAVMTSRTRAILLVHLYSSLADLDAFLALSEKTGVPIVEDCSQAHGAKWRGQRVGSLGSVGTFSFQNSKLLTAGEGGIVVSKHKSLYNALQQLRSDGRRWRRGPSVEGFPDLEEVGEWQGYNFCMTEFQAALLNERLQHLDEENERRAKNALLLESYLADIGHVTLIRRRDGRVTCPTFYHLPFKIDPVGFGGADIDTIRLALQAELGLYLEPVDPPLNKHVLYQPRLSRRFNTLRKTELDVRCFNLPRAAELSTTCFTLPHHALLAHSTAMRNIAEAFEKIKRHFFKL